MNEYLKTIVDNKIKSGLRDAKSASSINHPYLTGKLREIVLNVLIQPLLNKRFSIGTGKLTDYVGNLSKEIDICIYSENLHPPVFFTANDRLAIFPFESALSCIEVKTNLNKANLKDAFEKFTHINDNLWFTPGFHDEWDIPRDQLVIMPKYSVFAFEFSSRRYQVETILDIYKKIDPLWNSDPVITSICLADKGWLCFSPKGWIHMSFDNATKINEEIIGYLGTLIQDLDRTEISRGIPRIGYYLTQPAKTDRFVNGVRLQVPWSIT